MTGWKWRLSGVLILLACLAIAGCAQRGTGAEEERPGGFYGGVSAGRTDM